MKSELNNLIYEPQIFQIDCCEWLAEYSGEGFALSFVDPPFNQGKDYRHFDDNLPPEVYWNWLETILKRIYECTNEGGAIYFMQREKNAERVLISLQKTGWEYQNLIIWKKKTSAIPSEIRYSKQYQIIAFASKGKRPRVYNRLRINPPLPPEYKQKRSNGVYLTDIWDDIRELTSGYFAGDEALKDETGRRIHIQQSPIALLLRIILSSSNPGDLVFDPFAGTGTTLVVAKQLFRKSIGIEIDPYNANIIKDRTRNIRVSDSINRFKKDYICTVNLKEIWQLEELPIFKGVR